MRSFLSSFLPHPEGERRSLSVHRPSLTLYVSLVAVLYLFLNVYGAHVPGVLGFASNIFADRIVEVTNAQRVKNGLPPLKLNEHLTAAARRKAEDMFADDYWAHVAPDGTTPWFFITSSGYSYIYAGENLAKDFQNSDDVVVAWMNSPTHRKNILNEKFRDIGVAVVDGVLDGYETTLVVQMFGEQMPTVVAGSRVSAPVATPAPASDGGLASESSVEKVPSPVTKAVVPVGSEQSFISARTGSWEPLIPSLSLQFDVFTLTRTLALSIGFIVLLFFILDELVAWRRGTVRLSGHALAHFGLLLFLLGVVLFIKPGAIL